LQVDVFAVRLPLEGVAGAGIQTHGLGEELVSSKLNLLPERNVPANSEPVEERLRVNAAEKPSVMMEVVVCVEDHKKE
jgi:hypothetical protein